MPDVPITSASFNQAYRAYAVEQGNDVGQATQKSSDTANSTSAAGAQSESAVVGEDVAITISPEATRLYAESLKRRTTVQAAEEHSPVGDTESATADEEVRGALAEEEVPRKVGGQARKEGRKRSW